MHTILISGGVHPEFRKDRIRMDKITREDIDNMIIESFQETGSDDVLS